jgi:heme exporter protein B
MPSLSRAAAVILAKELRTEFRTRELLSTTVVFVLMVVVLFSFTFDPSAAESRRFGPGLLWLAFLFAGSLMLHPSFTREQANDTLSGLRLAPIEPFAILTGKILANLLFMLFAELILLPIFAVLYDVSLLPLAGRLLPLLGVLLLGTLGLTTTGTVFSAVAAQARMRELLLPLLLLPVLTPVLIASTEATAGLLADPPALDRVWLLFLAAFDIIFLTASWLFGEYLLEE